MSMNPGAAMPAEALIQIVARDCIAHALNQRLLAAGAIGRLLFGRLNIADVGIIQAAAHGNVMRGQQCFGGRPLAVTEIRPRQGFYDYFAKYTEHQAEHLIPAPIPGELYDRALEQALTAHRLLGCRGVSRADFRLDPDEPDGLYLLEVNTQPGMTPLSLVPEQAAHVGIAFADLVVHLVEEARCDE
jgi:hypothetical protein